MELVSVRVPGKVMLSGEYAVLYGGHAVLIPAPHYLEITVSRSGGIEELTPVVKASLDIKIPEIEDFELHHGKPIVKIDSENFYNFNDKGIKIKLGVGLSAAEAVGIIKLRFKRAGHEYAHDAGHVLEYAYHAHDEAQGGIGSGADVAACGFGKPIKFSCEYFPSALAVVRSATEIRVNHNYSMHLIWTAIASDTRMMIRQFGQWLHKGGDLSRTMMTELIRCSDELAEMWFEVPENELFPKLDEFTTIMKECADEAGVKYYTKIHDEISDWARANGGRAKPTGAGGGDMILLIGDLPVAELNRPVISLNL